MLLFNSRMVPYPGKLNMRWVNPYKIMGKLGAYTFLLSTLDGIALSKPIQKFWMKLYYGKLLVSEDETTMLRIIPSLLYQAQKHLEDFPTPIGIFLTFGECSPTNDYLSST